MGVDISIIDEEGNELEESSDLYFNYLRNPFGFRKFFLFNTGIDIRELPFFLYEEDYKNIYPSEERKRLMREKMEKGLETINQKD